MLAGPTEIVITSDGGDAALIAADLVAQAEHDPAALAIFISTNEALANQVLSEVKTQSSSNPIAKQSLKDNGCIFLASTSEEAQNITNRLAPEHLTIDTEADLAWVQNAGSVFIGNLSAQPLGDYISGPNHTLPTGGMATIRGGLSVMDYVKLVTMQQYSPQGHCNTRPASHSFSRSRRTHRPRRSHPHFASKTLQRRRPKMTQPSNHETRPRACIVSMPEYHPPLGNRDTLRLDFNENTVACSPAVERAIRSITAAELTRYPEREPVEALTAQPTGPAARTSHPHQRRR